MLNESNPSRSEQLAEVLGKEDMDELEEAIKAGMETIEKGDGFHESLDGPDNETKYILHKDGLPTDTTNSHGRLRKQFWT